MTSSIMEGISAALAAEFGSGHEIYMEEIRQDLKGPCFFIQCLEASRTLVRGRKYLKRSQFCVQYFPQSVENGNRECHGAEERMYQCLEYITAGRSIRGTKMHCRIVDGVLSFFVNYDCLFYGEQEEVPAMDEMASHTTVKEENGFGS